MSASPLPSTSTLQQPPELRRAQSVGGSGASSPNYGTIQAPSGPDLVERLASTISKGSRSKRTSRSKSRGDWDWGRPAKTLRGTTSRSSVVGRSGTREEDLYDSDADLMSSDEDEMRRASTSNGPHGRSHLREEGGDGESDGYASTTDGLLSPPQGHRTARKRRRSAAMIETTEDDKQWGVRKMELMGRFWGKKGLGMILGGVYLISTITSLEANTTPTVEPFFLSLLHSHSLLGAVVIVTNIAYAVGKPPFSKLVDVFGRAEGIFVAAALYSAGFILTSTATDVRVYVAARALAALGGQGLQLAQQIIIADTTTLTNRGLITSTISLPWLVTTWVGPPLGSWFQSHGEKGYRLAYLVFGLVLPVVAGVLGCTLLLEWHKAKRRIQKIMQSSEEAMRTKSGSLVFMPHRSWGSKAKTLWRDLDVIGLAALTIGCSLVLLPLALATRRPESWADVETWIMIVVGAVSLGFFGWYEFTWSAMPLIPPRILSSRTIMAGSALGFFHFISQFCYESFFTSFLQVARNHSPRDASYISQSYIFSASIAAIFAGAAAKYTKRYKWVGIVGVVVHGVGVWLMMRTRNLDSSTFELVLSQIIGGAGGGWTTIAAQIGCQSVVSHQDVGIATATFLTITQVGGAVGGCIASAVWSSLLPSNLRRNLPLDQHHLIPEIMGSLGYILSYPQGDPVRTAIDLSYVAVQRILNTLAIVMAIPALVAVLCMNNTKLDEDDQGQGEGVVVLGRASILDESDAGDSETSSLLGGTPDHHSFS